MDFLFSILGFVLAVGILVTVHEFGHFWVARSLGVKVLKFSIGFGRSLWSWRGRRDGTEYVIAMVPLGGFVRMLDETEDEVPPGEEHRAFNRKPLWVRTLVVLAGPMFNFLFAIVAYWLVYSVGIEGIRPVVGSVAPDSAAERAGIQPGDRIVSIDGRNTQTWGEHRLYLMDRLLGNTPILVELERTADERYLAELALTGDAADALMPAGIERALGIAPRLPEPEAVVGTVVEGSPAATGGLAPGDRIVAIDATPVSGWPQLVERVTPAAGTALMFEVERDGRRVELTVTPEPVETDGGRVGRVGIGPLIMPPGPEYFTEVSLGYVERTIRAVENTWLMSTLTLKMLWRMLKLEISTENLSGPITIAHYAGQTVQIGLVPFLTFLAVISVSLGVLNLLPIPVLDGGHLLYYLIEFIRGGPVPERVMQWGQQVGLVMLAGLMALAFYNDILRLVG